LKDERLTEEQLWEENLKLRQKVSELELLLKEQNPIFEASDLFAVYDARQSAADNPFPSYQFSDLVDIALLKQLLNTFSIATGIPYALNNHNNTILSRSGGQDICVHFHRVCSQTKSCCQQSDDYILHHLQEGAYIGYKCINGLMDYATPIIIEGQHLATIFVGQFFHEPPEEDFFRQQAKKYGFDENAYLAALRCVPIIPQGQIEHIMVFFSQLGELLATLGLERKRQLEATDQAIREREERLRMVLEVSTDGYWDWNVEMGDIIYSLTWADLLGYAPEDIEPHIRSWYKLLHPDDFEATMKTLEEHLEGRTAKYEGEYRMRKKSGEWQWIMGRGQVISRSADGKPLRMLGTFIDLTERKQIESEMTRLGQLNLVGEMAASIGHEIRNPMTTVRGYLQLLRENPAYYRHIDYFDLMIEEIDRANMIITDFLSLAKNKMMDLESKNINSILRNFYPLLQANAIHQDKSIVLDMQRVPELLLDENEIRQLILNLVNNGLDSISPGEKVFIRTFMENEKVVLAVQDQGCGISPDILNNIGIPFFTTKDQGTGLGLAVCYGIASRHNARIDIETSHNGTTFFIRFPA